MKKTVLAKIFTVVAGTSLLIVSCKNVLSSPGSTYEAAKNVSQKTYLTISLGDERTALPEVTSASFVKFQLTGVPVLEKLPEGVVAGNVYWETETGAKSPRNELKTAKISVVKGVTYTFTLTATTEGGAVYKDSVEKKIESSGNTISFSLKLVSIGTSGSGDAEITLKLPKKEGSSESPVQNVTVTVYKLNANGSLSASPVSSALTDKVLEIKNGKAIFESGNLPVGSYCAVFTLWNGTGENSLALDTWSEYFVIANELTSTSTMEDDGTNTFDDDDDDGEDEERTFTLDFSLDDDEGGVQGRAQ